MGMTLMADDRDIIIGELREGVRAIKDHLKRQDDQQLVRDQQTEANKREAIKAREAKEERDEQRFRVLDEKTTNTGGRVSLLEKIVDEEIRPVIRWHHDEGAGLGGRVSKLEQHEIARAAEKVQADQIKAGEAGERRGRLWAFGITWTALTMLGAAAVTYGRDIIDLFKTVPPTGN